MKNLYVLLIVCAMFLVGCSDTSMDLNSFQGGGLEDSEGPSTKALQNLSANAIASKQVYLIGTGIYDITGPAAEVGMMGYSMINQKTSGIHMRLRSRAYIIGDQQSGTRVVFVSADIGMIFQAVKQKVSAMILSNSELRPFYNEKNVLLSGNHTHSGPGGFSHYVTYNLAVLGFIKENFNAICNGIFNSILNAHRNLEPGYIYINNGDLENTGWNRSIDAYNKNPQDERDAYNSSQDKNMTLLKLVSASGKEIGMINWFAIHPTNIGNTNKLISGDNKGLAQYLFEKDKGANYLAGKTFTAAFAQTNSGDISPNIFWGYPAGGESDFEHMEIIARRQYDKAKALYNNAGNTLNGTIDFRHMYVDMGSVEIDPFWLNDVYEASTCSAAIGLPTIAGSTEDGKGVDLAHEGMSWGDGSWPKFTLVPEDQKCHKEKIILLPAGRMLPVPWIPNIMPVQIIKIGNLAIIAVPAEITTMAGRRLRNAVQDELSGLGVGNIVIASHSNAYSSYITTREEYSAQHYEGGSTQFGPYTLNAYQQSFAHIAQAMRNGIVVESGPTPADLSNKQINFQTGVVFDDKPLFKNFGDVYSNANSSYLKGNKVSVVFWGAHPKNNLRIQGTFLEVQKISGSSWITIARDWDPETRYIWKRDGVANSKVTIEWRIPSDTASGTYRIRHYGDWKSGWTGKISSYSGTSRTFTVN